MENKQEQKTDQGETLSDDELQDISGGTGIYGYGHTEQQLKKSIYEHHAPRGSSTPSKIVGSSSLDSAASALDSFEGWNAS